MELFAKMVNGFLPLTILEKSSILDASQGFEYTTVLLVSEFPQCTSSSNFFHCQLKLHSRKTQIQR